MSFLSKIQKFSKLNYHTFDIKPLSPDGPITAANCLITMDGQPISRCQSIAFILDTKDNQIAKIKLEMMARINVEGQIATEIKRF